MNKLYSIKVEFYPAYELVNSLYTYILRKEEKTRSLGSAWREQTKKMLPSSFAHELEDERWEVLHRTVLLISQAPQKDTVEKFLSWFESVPPGELYERLAPWVHSIPLNLAEIRDRTLYLLTNWNAHYFKHFDQEIVERLKQEAELRWKQAQKVNPVDLIEEVTNGIRIEPTEQLQQVVLVPQYHQAPLTVLDFFRGMATCLFPLQEIEGNIGTNNVLQMAQALADENRIKMLAFISKAPRTLIEIHEHLQLAKSTVHHHVTTLRRAGLIRSHYVDSTNVAYYSLREGFIDVLHAELDTLLRQ